MLSASFLPKSGTLRCYASLLLRVPSNDERPKKKVKKMIWKTRGNELLLTSFIKPPAPDESNIFIDFK